MSKSTFSSGTGRARRSRILAAALAAPVLASAVTAADAAYLLRIPAGFTAQAATQPPAPQATLVLSSVNVDFGSVAVTASATATVTLSNTGMATGAVAVTSPGAPFSVAHDCPADLAPAASCTLTFTFSPTAAGNATGSAMAAGQAVVLGGFGDMLLVSQIVAGGNHTLALKTDGTLWATGYNFDGQLGLGDTVQRTSFTQVLAAGTDVRSVTANGYFTMVLKTNGTLWALGHNFYGQLGLGDTAKRTALTQVVSAGNDVASIAAGPFHTLVRKTDGTLWATGRNDYGQLGLGDTMQRTTLTQVVAVGNGVASIAAGNTHTLALKTGGTLWTTGYNVSGELGLGDTVNRKLFTEAVSAGADVAAIEAGGSHTLVRKTDGTLWATGSNGSGQLGLSDTANRKLFTRVVSAGADVASVSAGDTHTIVLKTGGTLWATGRNTEGQLGFGDTVQRTSVTQVVAAGTDGGAIAAGGYYTLVLKADGTLWATGANGNGQLGLGDTTNRTALELVP